MSILARSFSIEFLLILYYIQIKNASICNVLRAIINQLLSAHLCRTLEKRTELCYFIPGDFLILEYSAMNGGK
jgi:hypothetical protein